MKTFLIFFKKTGLPVMVFFMIFFPIVIRPGYVLLPDFVWGPYAHTEKTYGILHVVYYIQSIFIKIFPISGLQSGIVQKLFLITIFSIIFYGGYQLARYILKYNFPEQSYQYITAIAMGIFSISNPWVYDRMLYGQVMVLLGYGFLLMMILFMYRLVYEQKEVFVFGIFGFYVMSILSSLHYIFIAGLPLVVGMGIWLREKYFLHNDYHDIRIKLSQKVILFILATILCLYGGYWLLQNTSIGNFALSIQVTDAYIFSPSQKTPVLESIVNMVTLSGFWGSSSGRYMNISQLPETRMLLGVIVLIAWYGIWINDRTRYHVFKKIGLGIVLLLSSGFSLPVVRNINYFLFTKVPLYTGLRETTKWQALLVVIYIIGVLSALPTLLKAYKKYQKLVLGVLFSVVFFSTSLTWWGYHQQIIPQRYPQGLLELFNKIPCPDSLQEKVVVFPWHMYQEFSFSNRMVINHPGKWLSVCNNIVTGTNMEFGGVYDNSQDNVGSLISGWVQGDIKKLPENVKYVIMLHGVDFQIFQEKLQKLQKIEKIYENPYGEIYKLD